MALEYSVTTLLSHHDIIIMGLGSGGYGLIGLDQLLLCYRDDPLIPIGLPSRLSSSQLSKYIVSSIPRVSGRGFY